MLDDPPDIGPDRKWPDDWSPEERVEAIADMLHQPRDADWVAAEADVDPAFARSMLAELAELDDTFIRVDEGYCWDERKLRQQKREHLAEKPAAELREELNRINDEIAGWRDQFDADSPDEVDDSRVAYDWRHSRYLRRMIRGLLADDAFLKAVGAVACGYESLPEAADRRGVDAEDVARALSRHQHREDYSGRLWADRRSDDTDDINEQPDYSDTRWSDDDSTLDVRSAEEIARANGVDVEVVEESIEAMSEQEQAIIDDRIEEIEDDTRHHSTEDVADDLGIDLGDRVTELDNEEALEDINDLLDDLPDEEKG
ncbi:DUF7342 family protein [Natrinema salaciae]|nr:hypothetical protein [Natrinema salaciae]